jgi:hypothetical protein
MDSKSSVIAQPARIGNERVRAYLIAVVLLVAEGAPVFRSPDADGYPLSTYPMFSHRRGRTNTVTSAIAVASDGSEVKVPPRYVANSETMQAFYTLARAVRAGEQSALQLCRTIVARLPEASDPALARAVRVELITESVDAIDYLAGRAKPFDRTVHARCVGPAPETR